MQGARLVGKKPPETGGRRDCARAEENEVAAGLATQRPRGNGDGHLGRLLEETPSWSWREFLRRGLSGIAALRGSLCQGRREIRRRIRGVRRRDLFFRKGRRFR